MMGFHRTKTPVSLRWKILFPIWWMIILMLLLIFLVSQWVVERYIHSCIEQEMESISNAAREVIEREYIYNEQLGGYQETIYRLAHRLLQSLNDLPRRIITTDYDIRFVVHTDEVTLHFITAEMANDAEEGPLATEITNRMLKSLTEEKMEENQYISRTFLIGETQYFAICMPLYLQQTTGVEKGFLISYVNTSSQVSVLDSMNRGLMMIMLIALVMAVFISLYITQRLSLPLRRLCEYAETIGGLDFRRKDLNSGIQELDELAMEMDRMACRLAEYEENQKKFLLNISHDLRTPLTSIEGYAESICYEVTDDPKRAADTILKESRHLEQMVGNLLFMSRMDMSADRLMFETIDLVQEVKETRDRMQVQIADRGCAVDLELPTHPVLIWGDEMHLARAIMNILSNALRYVRERITITLTVQDDQAVLSVKDDGPGFSEDDLKRLFDRFYKGRGGNFGVGMSIVKMIVEQMNGRVSADNLSEGGAVVTVWLPLLEQKPKETIESQPDGGRTTKSE